MSPVSLWLVLACVWALTHWWLLPIAKERWVTGTLRAKLARAGSIVVLEKARDLAAVGMCVLAVVIVLVLACGWLASGSLGVPQGVIAAAADLHAAVKSVGETYGAMLGALALFAAVAALVLAARHARSVVSKAWVDAAARMHRRLLDEPAVLEGIRADSELAPLARRIDELAALRAADALAPDGQRLGASEAEALHQELEHLYSMLAVELAQHEVKFDEVLNRASAASEPRGCWSRLVRMLSSERLGKDLGLVKKPLSHVTTALLVISLLGWSAEPLANSLQLALNNLRVNAVDEQAGRDLEQALSHAEPVPAESPDAPEASAAPAPHTAQSAARLLARVASRDLVRSGMLDRIAGTRRSLASEAEFVRHAIAGDTLPAPAAGETAWRLRDETAKAVGAVKAVHEPAAPVQEALEHELRPVAERMQARDPERFQRWARRLEARYAQPVGALDAQGSLVGKVIDEAFGAVDVKPGTEAGKQAQRLLKEFGKEAVQTWAKSWAKTWVTDTLVASARPGVEAAARGFSFEVSTPARQLMEELALAEGQGWARAPAQEADARVARAVAEKVAELHPPEARATVVERLGGYDELFPRPVGALPSPLEVALGDGPPVSGGGGGGGGGGNKSAGHATPSARTAAPSTASPHFAQARATNFHLASRSFRVRGVLIGRDAGPSGVDIDGLDWALDAGAKTARVQLRLRQGGRVVEVGSFEAGVVNQALRYASDRRVVATTITPGDGKVVGRVTYLHPVLADTPLGCRVVEADRLIDTFSFGSRRAGPSAALAPLASDREQMARWMGLVELTQALASMPRRRACPHAELARAVQSRELGAAVFSRPLGGALDGFIAAAEKTQEGSARVLQTARACAAANGAGLVDCLCEKAHGAGLPTRYWYPEDHTSQFRERAVAIDASGAWLRRTPDRLGHVDLWVHTTFSLRSDEAGDAEIDESTARAMDFPAEELSALRLELARLLPGYVREVLRAPSYDDFMRPLEDFILLQRLFRNALAGTLGRDVPLAHLVRLERETRPHVPQQATIRWEPVRGQEAQLLEVLQQSDAAAATGFRRWAADYERRLSGQLPVCDAVSR